jgi:hypothetical protein
MRHDFAFERNQDFGKNPQPDGPYFDIFFEEYRRIVHVAHTKNDAPSGTALSILTDIKSIKHDSTGDASHCFSCFGSIALG